MSERSFYTNPTSNVNITQARAVIGGKTYAMSNITSVSMVKKKVNIVLIVFLGLIGLGSLGLIAQSFLVTLIILAVCAGLIYLLVKPSYGVVIGSASGESHAVMSGKREDIEEIVQAISNAIVARG